MDISKLLVQNTEIITSLTNQKKPSTKKRHASRPSDMTRHYRIHTNDRPYQCPLDFCGKRFIQHAMKQRSALTVHQRTHSGEKPHICKYPSCNKSFADSSALARHRRIHSQPRLFVCVEPNCSKSYIKKSHLTRHLRRGHPNTQTYASIVTCLRL
ncbi:hypothetical protein A0J61_00776 [Choanephora cucurbitarum]|uniref:C2H2-type domain-containing protein n=1 Tax=Choanephora cucurbitarum TaxID=101091 RepID=A0A1C7NPV8_9FUNG|nr:hypothetical protein A0J61_00776 [Choanephora cucurbitarum]